MGFFQWIILVSDVALEVAVVAFLFRCRIAWNFPVFYAYIVFVLLRDLVLTEALSHPHIYFFAYWMSSPVHIFLTILATLENFWRVFRSFQLLRWFRFVLPTAILVALAYAAWQGYRFPPVEATPAGAAIINVTVAAHYMILAVSVLFFLLVVLLNTPWRIHEHRFMLGFGVASLAVAFGGSVRSVFGSHFDWISQQAQPIGYLVALLIWFSAAVHPVPENHRLATPPVENLGGLKFQLRNVRSFVRKNVR